MKMTTRSLIGGVVAGMAAFTQFDSPASAAVLINENFGSGLPDIYDLPVTGTVGAFTVSSGNIDLVGTSFNNYPGNGNYIDLNGSIAGTITSTSSFTFNPGDSATLSFDYGANGSGGANIFLGTTLIGSISAVYSSGSPLTLQTFNITTPTDGALSFVASTPGNGGIILDNIQFSSNTTAASVPEPSDMLGTVLAVGSIVMLKRKLTKKTLG
jgi:hypothetical protein